MKRFRVAVIGPMLGGHRGYITFMGEILSDLLAREGCSVVRASTYVNRGARLLDIAATLVMNVDRYDILLVQVYSGLSFVVVDLASGIAAAQNKKIVMHLHGGAFREFAARHPNWVKRVLARAPICVAPSAYLARDLETMGQKVRVISNVVELDNYPFRVRSRPRPRLFWMRAFHDIYNPHMAVRVLKRLRERYCDATLIMAGQDKGMESAVKRFASSVGVRSAVSFPGFLDNLGKARIGIGSDIFINTNRIDNMPVSIVEACAMGLPVVTTDVGGIHDLLTDGTNGLLVADDDDAAMAEAVVRLVEHPGEAERISLAGRELAGRSSWERVKLDWEKLFAELDTSVV